MLDHLKKSLSEVLTERTSSPFYGSFIISWLIWNWKILYLTIFVDQDLIKPLTKIQYIECHYSDWMNLILWPFLSTIFLVGIAPFAGNLAYKIYLFFEKERIAWKEDAEAKRRLTIEQSASIRNDMEESRLSFQRTLDSRNIEITTLKEQVTKYAEEKEGHKKNHEIIYAEYRGVTNVFEVTSKMTEIVTRIGKSLPLRVKIINEIFNDPDPGHSKEFFMIYFHDGQVKRIRVKEHATIEFYSQGWYEVIGA